MFSQAIVRPPSQNFADGLTTHKGQPPNHKKAQEQHESYCQALAKCGLTLTHLEPDEAHPDSTFVEDVAVLTKNTAILTRPGAKSREGEVANIRDPLKTFFKSIQEIQSPGTVDGGDICEAANHYFIGLSQRTNEEGAKQLAIFLAQSGHTSTLVDIRAMKTILHLKSGIAAIGEHQLVVMEEMADRPQFRGYEIIRVPPEETYAANCIEVNGQVLIATGFPKLAAALANQGFQYLPLEVSEFQKMDGGLSCLSLRF